MPKKLLSARFVDRAPAPEAGRIEYWDTREPGFVLRIAADGSKTYCAVGRISGKRARYTIGAAKDYELADARDKAKAVLSAMRRGENPTAEKRRQDAAPDRTFGAVVALYLESYAEASQRPRTYAETKRNLGYFTHRQPPGKLPARTVKKAQAKRRKVEAAVYWKERPIDEITKADVIARLDEIARHHGKVQANRCLAALRQFFNWCIAARDLLDASPCDRLKMPHKERRRERHFRNDEIPALWKAAGAEGYPFGDLVKLALLTGARRVEIAEMRWTEINFSAGLWEIPGERSKNGQPHTVPLSAPVTAILKAIPRRAGCDYVFTTNGETHVSGIARAVARMVKAANLAEPWTLHCFRHTIRTGLSALRVQDVIIRRVLNHAEKGASARYDHHLYDREKREALKQWGALVQRLVTAKPGANIADLEAARQARARG